MRDKLTLLSVLILVLGTIPFSEINSIPLEEPVITAFFPVKSNIYFSPYFPFQLGSLFSANATGPSIKSSLLNNSFTAE